jgi:hypothetical protein
MGYEDTLARARLSGLRLAPDGSRAVVSLAEAVDGATRSQLVEIDIASGRVDRGLDPLGGAACSAVYLHDGRLLVAASGAPDVAGPWLHRPESSSRVLAWANPIGGLAADVEAILYEELPSVSGTATSGGASRICAATPPDARAGPRRSSPVGDQPERRRGERDPAQEHDRADPRLAGPVAHVG